MFDTIIRHPRTVFLSGLVLGLLLGVGMLIGSLTATMHHRQTISLSEIPVEATAAVRSETIAAATGQIDDAVEGLFTLDYLTGELQCAVLYINRRAPYVFGGIFRANAAADLEITGTKKPNYLLLTGYANFRGGGFPGGGGPGACVAYVIDGNTGNFVTYGIPWNRNQASRGTPQGGPLVQLAIGKARMAPIRDQE